MLRSRIIPCLLVRDGALVKTVRFGEARYLGDPLNAVRIFNEKEVDELIVLDIDASAQGRSPDMHAVEKLAVECRMPLCVGGGVKHVHEIENLIALGVEKVALGAALISSPGLLCESARRVGSQSLVAVVDVAIVDGRYEVFTGNGRVATRQDPMEFARRCAGEGAGEIFVNAIHRDGTMQGYDLELASRMRATVQTPLTILGGAGSISDLSDLQQQVGLVGAAAGSLFVFKGQRRAVLINYPSPRQRIEAGLAPLSDLLSNSRNRARSS